jgi:hypothetical protein
MRGILVNAMALSVIAAIFRTRSKKNAISIIVLARAVRFAFVRSLERQEHFFPEDIFILGAMEF